MAKTLQFRDGSEDGPTGKFLLAVTHEAHRTLAPDQAEGVVAEVRDHLTAQVETQVMNGVVRSVAERDAVQGFGSARKFVRGVSASLYDTRRAEIARQVTFGFTILALAGGLLYHCRFGASPWASQHLIITGGLIVPLILMVAVAVGSWMGWRATPRKYALLGVGWVALLVLWTGFDTVTLTPAPGASVAPWEHTYPRQYSRSYMRRAAESATIWRDMAHADVERLNAGLNAFQVGARRTDSAAVVASLMQRYQLEQDRQRLQVEQALLERHRKLATVRSNTQQRAIYSQQIATSQRRLALLTVRLREMELAALQRNLESARKAAGSAAVQPFRTASGAYVAPRSFTYSATYESAFTGLSGNLMERGTYQSAADYARRYQQAVQKTPSVQFRSFAQARERWQYSGSLWLKMRTRELTYREKILEACRRVEAAPFGFNVSAVGRLPWLALFLLPFTLVLLNTIPATLARVTRRAWDGWLWRIRSAA